MHLTYVTDNHIKSFSKFDTLPKAMKTLLPTKTYISNYHILELLQIQPKT